VNRKRRKQKGEDEPVSFPATVLMNVVLKSAWRIESPRRLQRIDIHGVSSLGSAVNNKAKIVRRGEPTVQSLKERITRALSGCWRFENEKQKDAYRFNKGGGKANACEH
jgi:hypothetical protein